MPSNQIQTIILLVRMRFESQSGTISAYITTNGQLSPPLRSFSIFEYFQLISEFQLNYIYLMKLVLALLCLLQAVICSSANKHVYTQVTFMYDLKRGDLNPQFKRKYDQQLAFYDQILQTDSNLIVFGGKQLEAYVWERRKPDNTIFVLKQIETFKQLWYYPFVQKQRQRRMQDPAFPYKHYPQFALEYYNLIMFSKLYMLTYALQYDKFNTDVFIWTDGGNMHQSPRNLVAPDKLIKKLYQLMQPQWLFYTYSDANMFLGFAAGSQRYLSRPVQADEAILASNFGGYIETLRDVRCTYENLLRIVLQNGDMNSDESVLSLMPIKFPYLFPNTFGADINEFYQKFHI